MKIPYIIIFVIILNIILVNALTARIGNSVILAPVERLNEVVEKSISIENTNSVSVDVSLRASNEIKDVIEIVDNNFAIQSRESRNARFNIKLNKPGEYVGTIWVKISALGEVPIELPVRIVISAKAEGKIESQDEEPEKTEKTNQSSINFNLYKNLGENALLLIMSLSTTILSCILLFLLYQIKKKHNKKQREQGTLRKVDKDKLKKK